MPMTKIQSSQTSAATLCHLWQHLEEADNSGSEPPGFIAGMQYVFDAIQPLLGIAITLEPPRAGIDIDADFLRGMTFMLRVAGERIAPPQPDADAARAAATARAREAATPRIPEQQCR